MTAPQSPPQGLLDVRNLVKWFFLRRGLLDWLKRRPPKAVHAVDGISFRIEQGEVFGLVGESGCGKTTTGKTILRLYQPTSGQVFFKPKPEVLEDVKRISGGVIEDYNGYIDIANIPLKFFHPLRRELQVIYQDPYGSLNPRYRVRDTLEEPLLVHRMGDTREERLERVAKILEAVRLLPPEDFMERYPHMLSGGQRQRVAIARALILRPSLVVADEPVSMIDVSMRAELLDLMMRLKEEFGLTYIYITHDLATARYVCHRIAVMYLGKIVELGTADQIIDDPKHPYTQALIAAVPELDPSQRHKFRYVPIIGEVPSAVDIPPGCRFWPRCVVLGEHPELRDYCRIKEPPMIQLEDGRFVACWLYARK